MIEKGAQVRVKLIGLRSDVGSMYAIGSIKEDYLGSVWSSSLPDNICAKLQQCATAVNDLAIPNTRCECTHRRGIWKVIESWLRRTTTRHHYVELEYWDIWLS